MIVGKCNSSSNIKKLFKIDFQDVCSNLDHNKTPNEIEPQHIPNPNHRLVYQPKFCFGSKDKAVSSIKNDYIMFLTVRDQ